MLFVFKVRQYPQLTFICSKSTIETLKKAVEYIQSYNKNKNDIIVFFLVFLLLTLNMFHTIFYCFYGWLRKSKY